MIPLQVTNFIIVLAIAFRIIPILLQFRAKSKLGRLSLFLALYLLASLSADTMGLAFAMNGLHTAPLYNIHIILENTIAVFIAVEISKFTKFSARIVWALVLGINLVLLSYCIIYGWDTRPDFLWGLSRLFLVILISIAAFRFLNATDFNSPIKRYTLWALGGMMIYESISIIPLATSNLQFETSDILLMSDITFIMMLTANLIRDGLLWIHAHKSLRSNEQ